MNFIVVISIYKEKTSVIRTDVFFNIRFLGKSFFLKEFVEIFSCVSLVQIFLKLGSNDVAADSEEFLGENRLAGKRVVLVGIGDERTNVLGIRKFIYDLFDERLDVWLFFGEDLRELCDLDVIDRQDVLTLFSCFGSGGDPLE